MGVINNTRIIVRLVLGFGVFLVLLASVSIFGIKKVDDVNTNLNVINQENSVKQRYAINFRGSVHDRAIALRDVYLVSNDRELNEAISEIDKLYDFYQESAVKMDALFAAEESSDPQEVEILNRIKQVEIATEPLIAQTVDLITSGQTEEGYAVLMEEARPLFTDWLGVINEFIDLMEAKNSERTDDTFAVTENFASLSTNVLFASIAITVLIGFWILPAFLKLRKVTSTMERVASGDLLVEPINSKTKCEVGSLGSAVDSMIHQLRTVIQGVQRESSQISEISHQLEATSAQLAKGSNEQAAFVEEISSTMEEVAININQNTENARKTDEISTETNRRLKEVGERSKEVIEANETINSRINMISEIAFQTNVLALNAAIEAARAGDAGKGFAVVASEVQMLAEKSKSVSDEIIGLTRTAYDISNKTGEVMTEAIPQMEETSNLVRDISLSTEEQSKGTTQVNQSIQQLNSLSQQSAASSEELAASAESLADQSNRLKESISFYRLGSTAYDAPVRASIPNKPSRLEMSHSSESLTQGHTLDEHAFLDDF